jgi:hypothetical protein
MCAAFFLTPSPPVERAFSDPLSQPSPRERAFALLGDDAVDGIGALRLLPSKF